MSAAVSANHARIGPNAITRVAEALRPRVGDGPTDLIFSRAGLANYLARPPEQMVAEAEVTRLHAVLREVLGSAEAREVACEAGRRTADYLLAHRIPKPVQALLERLPAALSARVLLAAIARHAWTFAGSGRFGASAGHPVRLVIQDNPLCRGARWAEPGCDFYATTFERLFRALVHPDARATETACEACGADACRFEIRWKPDRGERRRCRPKP